MSDFLAVDPNVIFALILGLLTFTNLATLFDLNNTKRHLTKLQADYSATQAVMTSEAIEKKRILALLDGLNETLTSQTNEVLEVLKNKEKSQNLVQSTQEKSDATDTIDTWFAPAPIKPYGGMERSQYKDYVQSVREKKASSRVDSSAFQADMANRYGFDFTTPSYRRDDGSAAKPKKVAMLEDLITDEDIVAAVAYKGTMSGTEAIVDSIVETVIEREQQKPDGSFIGVVDARTGIFTDLRPAKPDTTTTDDVWAADEGDKTETPGLLPRPVMPPKRIVEKPVLRKNSPAS